ncbi:uncharacterized protein LOC141646402 [Silene latifolia]|uniref:uncharacterized protein LOC141646402 n=1 Tax=Silene latifolia TaxID=37657 RepID=UPI003D7863E0
MENDNRIIRTKNMDRQFLLEKSKGHASGDTMFKGETEKAKTLRTEFEEINKLKKELKASRRKEEVLMHDLDRLQKTNNELVVTLEEVENDKKCVAKSSIALFKMLENESKKALRLDHFKKVNKELVAKLEEVEMDKKIAVESRIKLMKILDEEMKKVSCLEKKCLNLEKRIELQEKLEAEREKNRALEEEVGKYKRLVEENDLIARRKEGSRNIIKFECAENMERKAVLKADEKWEKVEVEREEMMERIASVEKRLDGLKNTIFGDEDDTVYVDFDGFLVVGNF